LEVYVCVTIIRIFMQNVKYVRKMFVRVVRIKSTEVRFVVMNVCILLVTIRDVGSNVDSNVKISV